MTIAASHRIAEIANAIRTGRYPDAAVVFAAGSIVRGEGTPTRTSRISNSAG